MAEKNDGIFAFLTNTIEEPQSGLLAVRENGVARLHFFFTQPEGARLLHQYREFYKDGEEERQKALKEMRDIHEELVEKFPVDADTEDASSRTIEGYTAERLAPYLKTYAAEGRGLTGKAVGIRVNNPLHRILVPRHKDRDWWKGPFDAAALLLDRSAYCMVVIRSRVQAYRCMAENINFFSHHERMQFSNAVETSALPIEYNQAPCEIEALVVAHIYDALLCGRCEALNE